MKSVPVTFMARSSLGVVRGCSQGAGSKRTTRREDAGDRNASSRSPSATIASSVPSGSPGRRVKRSIVSVAHAVVLDELPVRAVEAVDEQRADRTARPAETAARGRGRRSTRERSACESRRLSYSGRKRGGAGVSGSGSAPSGTSNSSRPRSSRNVRSCGRSRSTTSRRPGQPGPRADVGDASPDRTRRGSAARARRSTRSASSSSPSHTSAGAHVACPAPPHSPRGGTCTSGPRNVTACASAAGSASGQRGASSARQLGARARPLGEQLDARPRRRPSTSAPASFAAHGLLNVAHQDRQRDRREREAVARRDEVDRRAHERRAHRLARRRSASLSSCGVEVAQARPQRDVGVLGHLRLHADEPLDHRRRRHPASARAAPGGRAARGSARAARGPQRTRPAGASRSSRRLGHIRRSAHAPHAGRCAWHVRRPWRRRLTCSSSSAPGGREREHRVVQLLERRLRAQQAQARADARDVRVDRHVAQAEGEQQHAGGGLAPDARQRAEVGLRLGDRRVAHPVEVERVADRAQDRLDARRLHLRDAAGPDRLLDLLERRVADRLPDGEALAQAQVGDVAVAVVRRLREDRQDELGERVAVRRRDRDAVDARRAARGCARRARARRPPAGARRAARRGRRSLQRAPALAGAGGLLDGVAAARRRSPTGRSPSCRGGRAATPMKTSPAPIVLSDARRGAARRRSCRPRARRIAPPAPSVTIDVLRARRPAATPPPPRGRVSPVISRASAALHLTRNAPGTHAPQRAPARRWGCRASGAGAGSGRRRSGGRARARARGRPSSAAASALPASVLEVKNSASVALDGARAAARRAPPIARRRRRRRRARTSARRRSSTVTNATAVRWPVGEPEPAQVDAARRRAGRAASAPQRVVAGAAGERDRGAARAPPSTATLATDAARVRDERVGLGERGDGPLADEVDDRLAEAEGPHAAGGYLPRAVPTVTEETHRARRPAGLPAPGRRRRRCRSIYLHGIADELVRLARRRSRSAAASPSTCPASGAAASAATSTTRSPATCASSTGCSTRSSIDRVRLCVHDWGAAVGLAWAVAQPERVQRLVVVNGVPLLGGFRWRGPARLVRMPVVGPIAVGSACEADPAPRSRGARRRRRARCPSRSSRASPRASTSAPSARCWLLLRSSPPDVARRAPAPTSARSRRRRSSLWGAQDPLDRRRASAPATRRRSATRRSSSSPDAGHWPWLDRPEVGDADRRVPGAR